MENIGDIDIDQVIDVPDTPDRLAARNIIRKRSIGNRSDTPVSRDHGSSNFLLRGRSRLPPDNGHNKGLDFRSHRSFNNPRVLQHQNNAILHISDSPPVSSNNNTYNRTIAGQIPKHATINSFGGKLMDNGKALSHKNHMKESTFPEGNADPDLMEQTGYNRINGKALMQGSLKDRFDEKFKEGSTARNGSSHCMPNSSKASSTSHKGKATASEDTHSALGTDYWKGIDIMGGFPPKTGKLVSASLHSIPSPRITGQKRLVRNGCISPLNIAKAKHSVQPKENSSGSKDVENTNMVNLVSKSPSCVIDLSDSSVESNKHVRTKGKGLILHSSSIRELGEKNRTFSGSLIKHNSEATGASDVNAELSLCSEELEGWCNTGNCPKKIDLPMPNEHINPPRIPHAASTLIKRQKKHESTSSNHDQYSVSGPDDSDIMFPCSSVESSNSRSNINLRPRRRSTLDPLVEVDELSPEMVSHNSQHMARKNNADSNARARQLEADEILALELQEQFYQETPTDAHIAWTLQQEEATERASSSGSHGILHSRRSSISAVQRQPRPRSLQNPSIRTRLNAREPTSGRMAQLRGRMRNQTPSFLRRGGNPFPFPLDMDLDTRLDILEALEATVGDFGDMTMGNRGLQTQRDFNENDYEMLLALDENNYQHGGARVDQINRLPQLIVQSDNNSDEPCAICLETPAAGETIRHLPCFHKFHKDCIDPWLNRKTSCPVCKSSIT